MDILQKIRQLPDTSGVYLMKNEAGEVLYIGKAGSLRKRVASYFQKDVMHGPLIGVLVKWVTDIDYIETPTEVEALLLEAQLVNQHKPRYNTRLKDDKSYPLVKITREPFPKLVLTREKTDPKARYYGPFTDARLLREALRLIHEIFPIRKCRVLPKTACLYYHLGQCIAPCIYPEKKKEYSGLIDEISSFLGGGKKSLIEYLTEKMETRARELKFEEAQIYKGQIQALSQLRRKRFDRLNPNRVISTTATSQLKQILNLKKYPERIVCFDVSNIMGHQAVASKVSFFRELPDTFDYRRYKIKTVTGIDDYSMIQEALRRMIRGIREGREEVIPDVIVIDGGKGHLNAAHAVLCEEAFTDVALISIAKRFEQIYTVRSSKPLPVERDSPLLHLVQKVRDEAHRFAVTYHRKLRGRKLFESVLDEMEGIGHLRKRALIRAFGSVEELKKANAESIAYRARMPILLARKVREFLLT
ncbi:MAG: excinuclease ABC subunit UvrC [Candidatus Omnitrophica bacterium]|nr:excinuclease ABC subunit UvrC [Candidatus Omnitrophota bacterium]